ncbi:MAG: hypothetical protein WCQ47_03570 [bacterium]
MKKIIFLVLFVKIIFFIVIYVGYKSYPFHVTSIQKDDIRFYLNPQDPQDQKVNFLSTLQTWDAGYYRFLAEHGYQQDQDQVSNAMYPLFPLLVRLVNPVFFGNTVLAGIVLSNLFSIIAVLLLYLLVIKLFSPDIAFKTILLFLSFPTAFYMNLMYTESLFLMLVLGFFYYLYNNKIIPTAVFALLLPLCRPQGILIVVPLVFFILSKYKYKLLDVLKSKENILVAVFFLGWTAYFCFMYMTTGLFFSGFDAQDYFVAQNSLLNIFRVDQWFLDNFINVELSLHGFTNSIIDRTFFIFYLVSLYFIYRKTDKTFFVYALFLGLIPALSDHFTAYTRYLLPLFPMFIVFSIVLKNKVFNLIVVLLFSIQIIFAVRHCLNYWVA